MSLQGKVALITGGGTGIGFGIAQVLIDKGARLVIAQRRFEKAQAAAKALTSGGVLALEVDIRDPIAVDHMMRTIVEQLGRIDILVNNASITGTAALSPFLSLEAEDVHDLVDINLKGTIFCSQAAAKQMIAAGAEGSIVQVSSVAAFAAQELAAIYCCTKAAQVSLTQSMALELAPHGIRVNCVAPGDIATEASAMIDSDKQRAGGSGRYRRVTPLDHRGSPTDIGHAVAYLVSPEARFVTGSTLVVDGGFLAY